MKIRVIKVFKDKKTRERYNVGDVIDFEKKRAEEAIEKGLAKKVKTEKKESKPKRTKKEE
ncbi:MAG: hypothetical protein ACTHY1_03485 [Lactobacillus helveticus]